MFSYEFGEICHVTPFLKNPLDGGFSINTFHLFKNDVTHIFQLSLNFKSGNKSELNILNPQPEVYFEPSETSAREISEAVIRSSHLLVFCKRRVLKTFAKVARKHLHQSLFFNRLVQSDRKKDENPTRKTCTK